MKNFVALALTVAAGTAFAMDAAGAQAVAPPYSISFGETQDGWTAIDEGGTDRAWTFNNRGIYYQGQYKACIKIEGSWSNAQNDWYVSPAISLKAGTDYVVKTTSCYGAVTFTLALEIGTSASDMSANRKIGEWELPGYSPSLAPREHQLKVDADGEYFISFHAEFPTGMYEGFLLDFAIEEEGGGGEVPDNPDDGGVAVLPYSINFKETAEGWEAVDRNEDNNTWNTDYLSWYGVYINGNYTGAHNDDFVSPKFALKSGSKYKINTTLLEAYPPTGSVVTLVAGTDKNDMAEVKRLSITAQGENADEADFEPATDGEYYFAFRNTSPQSYASITGICNFSISEVAQVPDAPLVSTDFTGDAPLKDWTVTDANNDQSTWTIVDGVPGVTYDSETAPLPADDWLISPAMQMNEGEDYLVTYTLRQAGAFSEDVVEVRSGGEATAAGLTTLLSTMRLQFENGNGEVTKTVRISSKETGLCHIGFHVITEEANGTVSLCQFVVAHAERPTPRPVEGLSATSDYNEKLVSLIWKNPTADTAGADLTEMDIRIYANGTLVETLHGVTAGEEGTYAYSPEDFTGDVTYEVTAVIGENESVAVSTTICLDDVQGELRLVEAKPITSDHVSDWVIANNSGNSVWGYDMMFYFKHLLGSPTDEDDWLISPSFQLETGKRYVVKFRLGTNMSYGATFDLTLGEGQTEEAQQRVLNSYVELKQNGMADFQSRQFSVDAAGSYNVGFHVTKVEHSISLNSLEVYYIDVTSSALEDVDGHKSAEVAFVGGILAVPADADAVRVYDASGRLVWHQACRGEERVDLTSLQAGIYLVHVTSVDGNCTCVKLAK